MYTPADLQPANTTPMTAQKIYTTHTAGKDIAYLPALLSKLEAVLVDIRFAPPEQPIKWSKTYLKLLLKNKYLHVPHLGNRAEESTAGSYRSSIQNLALGIKVITELKIDLILFCSCERVADCHRLVISNELTKRGIEVTELTKW